MAVFFTVLFPSFIHWDDYKFILSSLFIVVFLVCQLRHKPNLRFDWITADVTLFLFILFGLISSAWSIDPSLNWTFSAIWILMGFWMLVFRSFNYNIEYRDYCFKLIRILFWCSAFYLFGSFLFLGDIDWVKYSGNNSNHIACSLLLVLPAILYTTKTDKIGNLFRLLGSLSVLSIALLAQSSGVLIILILFLGFYFFDRFELRINFKTGSLGFVLLLILILIVRYYDGQSMIYEDSDRALILESGIRGFKDNPLLGAGLGNWLNAIFWTKIRSHNLYLHLIIERGLVGTIFYIVFLSQLLFPVLRNFKSLSPIFKSSACSIVIFIIACLVYNIADINNFTFGIILFVTFCNIGILTTSDIYKSKTISKLLTVMLLCCSLIITSWFLSNMYYNQKFRLARRSLVSNPDYSLELLEECLSPTFRTTVFNKNKIALQIANIIRLREGAPNIDYYYNICENTCPNDFNYLVSRGSYLYEVKGDTLLAMKYLFKAEKLDISGIELDLMMVKYFIDSKQRIKANNRLALIKSPLPLYKRQIRVLQRRINDLDK